MSTHKVIPLFPPTSPVPDTVEALLARDQPAPPKTTETVACLDQETRIYLLNWVWKSGEINLSCQRLLLTPDGVMDIRHRFQTLLDTDEILAFALEEEPAECMTLDLFIQNTPILWPGLPEDDTPFRPDAT